MDVICTKVLRVFLLCYSQLPLLKDFTPPPPRKSDLKLACNVKPESSQDYAQKPQRNCTFMNSSSVLSWVHFYDKGIERVRASKKGREERERERRKRKGEKKEEGREKEKDRERERDPLIKCRATVRQFFCPTLLCSCPE